MHGEIDSEQTDGLDGGLRRRWQARKTYFLGVYVVAGVLGLLLLVAMAGSVWAEEALLPVHAFGVAVAALAFVVAVKAFRVSGRGIVRWNCHACGKSLDTNEIWTCGFCDYDNKASEHSVLHKCQRCKARPPGYVCHHCAEPTWFDADGDRRHPARQRPEPRPGETEEQARTRRTSEIAEKQFQIERLRHEAEIHRLTNQAERLSNPPKPPDPDAAMEQQLERALHRLKVGMQAVARSKKLQAEVDREINANSPGLSAEEVEQLREYARRQFNGYREDITLGRYDA